MPNIAWTLGIAALMTIAVGVISGGGTAFLVGALLALVLWVILFFANYARPEGERGVDARAYLVAAVITVALGAILVSMTDVITFWPVGAIIAGAVVGGGSVAVAKKE
ncbi:hypothetical protein [Janibacter sp. GXQ6167]|uniref:hypothetical protein n=1 Tax=Janibacter sp. GXQ6167 TaxID=3240791 RepID=UPI003524AAE6